MNIQQISLKLDELPIEAIALRTNFSVHSDNEITAKGLLLSFFLMITKNTNTLSSWTSHLSILLRRVFSISGLRSKLTYRHVLFAEELLGECLKQELFERKDKRFPQNLSIIFQGKESSDESSEGLSYFNRILVEDSTCVKLPDNLATIFKGAFSKTKNLVATARIQCRIDLKENTILRLAIQSFRDNDQKFSSDIIDALKPNDLVLRDLGYWSLKVFRKIIAKQAYVLSRFRYGTYVYHNQNEEQSNKQINLCKYLKKAKRNGLNVVTLPVLVGKAEQLPLRLIAIKIPAEEAEQRKRRAKNDRNKKANHSKEYMELLEWTIFVTNIPENLWTPQQILEVYGFRWRIEIIFKCWKSNFNFAKLFEKKQSIAPPRAWITFYFLLIWIMLFFNRLYNFVFKIAVQQQIFISVVKFSKFFKEHFVEAMNVWFIIHEKEYSNIIKHSDVLFFLKLSTQICAYDRKNKSFNFCQILYMLFFTTR